jgi:4-hydroxyphenylpyruvate dioxygenase-like putative hemolysin
MTKEINLKSPFSKIDQIGVIVKDLDQAVEYYSSLGIGPFEPLDLTRIERSVYGKPARGIRNRSRVAQMGSVQLELLQPVSGESVQMEFLEKRGEGINHLGFLVDDLETEVVRMRSRGFTVISSVKYAGGGGVAYLDTDRIGGVLFELIQWPSR